MRIGYDFRTRFNSELYEVLNEVVQRINIQRLRWLGHVFRMEKDVPARQVLEFMIKNLWISIFWLFYWLLKLVIIKFKLIKGHYYNLQLNFGLVNGRYLCFLFLLWQPIDKTFSKIWKCRSNVDNTTQLNRFF